MILSEALEAKTDSAAAQVQVTIIKQSWTLKASANIPFLDVLDNLIYLLFQINHLKIKI